MYATRELDASKAEATSSRMAWLGTTAVTAGILAVAAFLAPDPSGHGTHTQLGLPPCGFLLFTTLPCPGCGLTTAFSHMVRGQLTGAIQANPLGVLLFGVTVGLSALAAVGALVGLPFRDTFQRLHADKVAVGLAVVGIAVWVARLAMSWAG